MPKLTNVPTSVDLAALEPIVNQLLLGTANPRQVAQKLEALGFPNVVDQTEQLRLALRLLECHDDSKPVSSRSSKRPPEAEL